MKTKFIILATFLFSCNDQSMPKNMQPQWPDTIYVLPYDTIIIMNSPVNLSDPLPFNHDTLILIK